VSREAVEGLRMLRMFIQLSPSQRKAVIELIEQFLPR